MVYKHSSHAKILSQILFDDINLIKDNHEDISYLYYHLAVHIQLKNLEKLLYYLGNKVWHNLTMILPHRKRTRHWIYRKILVWWIVNTQIFYRPESRSLRKGASKRPGSIMTSC